MIIDDVLEDEFSSDEGGEGTHGNLWMVWKNVYDDLMILWKWEDEGEEGTHGNRWTVWRPQARSRAVGSNWFTCAPGLENIGYIACAWLYVYTATQVNC